MGPDVEVPAENGDVGGHITLSGGDPVQRLLELSVSNVVFNRPMREVHIDDANSPDCGQEELAHDAHAPKAQ